HRHPRMAATARRIELHRVGGFHLANVCGRAADLPPRGLSCARADCLAPMGSPSAPFRSPRVARPTRNGPGRRRGFYSLLRPPPFLEPLMRDDVFLILLAGPLPLHTWCDPLTSCREFA